MILVACPKCGTVFNLAILNEHLKEPDIHICSHCDTEIEPNENSINIFTN